MKCLVCLVSGRVQGVFYRASTQQQAVSLGLNGWVKNLPNGQVELKVWGPDATVDELVQWLWKGPAHANVHGVQCSEDEAENYTRFDIR